MITRIFSLVACSVKFKYSFSMSCMDIAVLWSHFLQVCSTRLVSGERIRFGCSMEPSLLGPSRNTSADLNGLIKGRGAVGNTIERLKNPNKISFITVFNHNA